MTYLKYFEYFYYFISILPGFSILMILLLSLKKTDNKLLFSAFIVYLSLSVMSFMQFIDFFLHDILGNPYLPVPLIFYTDLVSISLLLYFVTKIVLLLFYDKIWLGIKLLMFLISAIPLLFIVYSFFAQIFVSKNFYQFTMWITYCVLFGNSLVFGIKYKSIRDDIQKKLFKTFWLIVSFFMIIFILDRIIPDTKLNPLPLFYMIISIIILVYYYKGLLHFKKRIYFLQTQLSLTITASLYGRKR